MVNSSDKLNADQPGVSYLGQDVRSVVAPIIGFGQARSYSVSFGQRS